MLSAARLRRGDRIVRVQEARTNVARARMMNKKPVPPIDAVLPEVMLVTVCRDNSLQETELRAMKLGTFLGLSWPVRSGHISKWVCHL